MNPPPTIWEYLFLEMPVNGGTFLPDDYGSKGWELVAVVKASPRIDRMWFKRPKQPMNRPRKRTTSPQPPAPCLTCKGSGTVDDMGEMNFPNFVPCPSCSGRDRSNDR